jgi:phycoerythrin-associated linker protein
MDIQKFLQQSAGKWFAQRTVYKLSETEPENTKAEVTLEMIAADDPKVVQLCQANQVEVPRGAIANSKPEVMAISSSWDNSVDWGQPKQVGSSLVVFLPNADHPTQGQFVQQQSGDQKLSAVGQYLLTDDDTLVVTLTGDNLSFEERFWFPAENLRLRTTLLKSSAGVLQTSFYSEIRRITSNPA